VTDAPVASSPSTARRITSAVLAMWGSRVVAIACSLALMPILFRRLPSAELGVWLLLSQSGTLVLLLDFGLTSTLIRRFAFLRGEASAEAPGRAAQDHALAFGRLAATGRGLYRMIAVGVGGICWIGGLIFLSTLELDPELLWRARCAWTIICVGQMAALSSGLWTAAISGLGYVAPVALISIGFTSLTLLVQCALALAGGGLVSLAVASALGGIALRIAAIRYLARKEPGLAAAAGRWDRAEAAGLMAPSLKYFLTEIGALMLMRSDQYFIAGYLDPKTLPTYVAAYTLASNAAVISIAIGDAASIYVSQLWRTEARGSIRAIVMRSTRVGMGLMALGAALLLFAGPAIMTVWLGEGHFVGAAVMTIFSAMLLIYTQQSLLFSFSRATENEIYAPWYIVAGVLNIALSFVLTPTLGLPGVALSTLLAQAATTGWFIPRSALRRLDIPARLYVRQVLVPIGALLAAACGAVWLVTEGPLAPVQALGKLMAAVTVASALAAVAFWRLVLDDRLRGAALSRIGLTRKTALAGADDVGSAYALLRVPADRVPEK